MYVIYDKDTTYFLRVFKNGYWQDAQYETQGAAKAALTRLSKKEGEAKAAQYRIAEKNEFHSKIEKTRKTRNILNPSAGEFDIPVNTPACCDPGTETYHSM